MSTSKENFLANVKRRLKCLKVAANTAAVETGHRDGWLTDILRRSDIPLDIGDEIAQSLGMPLSALIEARCPVTKWPAPPWVEPARERIRTAQQRGAVTRAAKKADWTRES